MNIQMYISSGDDTTMTRNSRILISLLNISNYTTVHSPNFQKRK